MLKEQYLSELKKSLNKANDKEYTRLCIEYAENLLNKDLPVVFDLMHLQLLLGLDSDLFYGFIYPHERKMCNYSMYKVPKKAGGYRIINSPSEKLKTTQKWILENILNKVEVLDCINGFSKKKSILTNAKAHLKRKYVLNIDIQEFFDTIKFGQVISLFYRLGYSKSVAFALTKICTQNGSLPQGAPTSPALSNLVVYKMDRRLDAFARKEQLVYTRYADDITISGDKNIISYLSFIEKIINDEGFELNNQKTRCYSRNQRQEVTGLVVNGDVVKVKRDYKRKLLQEIYYCKKFGVDNHLAKIESDKHFYKEHLYGKALYIRMVEKTFGDNLLSMLDEIEWEY